LVVEKDSVSSLKKVQTFENWITMRTKVWKEISDYLCNVLAPLHHHSGQDLVVRTGALEVLEELQETFHNLISLATTLAAW